MIIAPLFCLLFIVRFTITFYLNYHLSLVFHGYYAGFTYYFRAIWTKIRVFKAYTIILSYLGYFKDETNG